MVVTHPSGHVDTYTKEYLQQLISDEQINAARLQTEAAKLENHITEIDNSLITEP